MSLQTSGVTSATDKYAVYETSSNTKSDTASSNKAVSTVAAETVTDGAVYEKSTEKESNKGAYKINKMSADDRAALVKQLQADQANRKQQMMDLVQKMFSEQASSFGQANDIWKFLAKGDFTVDEKTKAQAQEDISENGYYGVKQTSERLFDFASALAGDDKEKMKEMQAAVEKGFKQATKTWGSDLPSICKETLDATNKLFDEYFE